MTRQLGLIAALAVVFWQSMGVAASPRPRPPYKIPVLVICYFPVRGDRLDIKITGDWGESLAATRAKTARQTAELVQTLEQGSRYHGYRNIQAQPSLKYQILKTVEYLQPLPTWKKPGHSVPMTDYQAIAKRVNLAHWVEQRGVKEVWIWGYHGGKVDLWESNMAGPFGDISNSDRDPQDLPALAHTYTVYHYNYQRGTSEATEDHMHQIEHVLNYVDGRDATPREQWNKLLFWGKFVGSDLSHKIVRPGCGWSHYPPNGERDYDWANPRYVETDMEDWKPDGTGKKQRINCQRWGGDSLRWFIYWMQNLPGQANGLRWQGQSLGNWWVFIGAFDEAMKGHWKLTGAPVTAADSPPITHRPTSAVSSPGIAIDGDNLDITRSVKIKPGRYLVPDNDSNGVLRIRASNSVVDMQGASLTSRDLAGAPQDGLDGVGIELTGCRNVTLKNAVVEGYRYNIRAKNCDHLRIENCRANRSRAQRIARDDVPIDVWLGLRDLGAWRSYGAGLWLENCRDSTVRRCSASAAQNGLILVNCTHDLITDNDFSYNSGWGVALWQAVDNEVSWNHLDFVNRPWGGGWGGDSAALALVNRSNRNYLVGNSLTHGGDGFFLTNRNDGGFDPALKQFRPKGSSDNNLIAYNDGSWAQANAFEGTFSVGNVYFRNQANDSNYGFWLGFSSQSSLIDNDIRRNRNEGIAIEHGRSNRIEGNRLIDTGGTAIHLWAVPEAARAAFPSTDLELRGNLIRKAGRAFDLSGSTRVTSLGNTVQAATRAPFPFLTKGEAPSARERLQKSPMFGRLSAILARRPGKFKFLRDLPGPRGLEWMEPGDFAPKDWRGHLAQIRKVDPGSCEVYLEGQAKLTVPPFLAVKAGHAAHFYRVEPLVQRGEVGQVRQATLKVRAAQGRSESFTIKLLTAVWHKRWYAWGQRPSKFEDSAGWSRLFASKPLLEEDSRLLSGDFSYRSPRPGVPDHNFALLATTRLHLESGEYRFSSLSDDGLRVYLDGRAIISRWNHHGATADEARVRIKKGVHDLRVEYCQADGAAVLRLHWAPLR